MYKKLLGLALVTTFAIPVQLALPSFTAQAMASVNVENLVDLSQNHWAYNSVKYVVQDLGVLSPKTPTRFMGNDQATRYEVANVLYNSVKKLEAKTGKNLKVSESSKSMSDIDKANKDAVNAIVNEYGVMEALPGNKFMGTEKMTRYELSFALGNYLSLLEKKLGKMTLSPVNKMSYLSDINQDHWATPSVKNVVDKYQIMSGYPNSTFMGSKILTRYELSAVLKNFFDNVEKYFEMAPVATPEPTPVPTPVATPEPTPVPTPEPTPVPVERPELKAVDLKIGGNYKVSKVNDAATNLSSLYGPSAGLNIWFNKSFGIGANADYMIFDSTFGKPGLARATFGGDLNLRLLGNYADDFQMVIGAGWNAWNWMKTGQNYINHGPKAKLDIEIPLGSGIALFANDSFTYMIGSSNAFTNNPEMVNDLYTGINIPAYSLFSIQAGYTDTRYKIGNNWSGDIGGRLNLRFRF